MGKIYIYKVHDDNAIVRVEECSLPTIKYDSECNAFLWYDRSGHMYTAFSDEIALITTNDNISVTELYFERYNVKWAKPPKIVFDILERYIERW